MKKIFFAISILFLGVILFLGFMFLNRTPNPFTDSEKENYLSKILGRKVNLEDKSSPKGDTEYKSQYISFMYPVRAKIYTRRLNNEPIPLEELDYFSFDLDNPRMIFSMEVQDSPPTVANIEDYPGVRLREVQNNLYVKKDVIADGVNGLLFDKYSVSSFEKTAFFYLNKRVYAITVSGNDLKQVEDLFNKVILSTDFL